MINVIVAFPRLENAKSIKSILVKNAFGVNAVCTTGAQVLHHADMLGEAIVVCAGRLPDVTYTQLREYLPPHFPMLVVSSPKQREEGTRDNVVFLTMPLKVHELVSTLEMMSHDFVRRRKKRNSPPIRSKEERQILQKAKETLMERNDMTEEEAHRYMQKSSMDSGTNMAEAAEMILTMIER